MDARNCRSCGSLFNYIGGEPICASCKKKMEDVFLQVREYLDEHPNATINEVSEEVSVSVKQIKQWIREERLTLSDATDAGITCLVCGVQIKSGRYCDRCKTKMQNDLASVTDKPRAQEPAHKRESNGNRMRFFQ